MMTLKPAKRKSEQIPMANVRTPGNRKLEPLGSYKSKLERAANSQSLDALEATAADLPYELDAAARLRKRFPISKNADQVADDMNKRILELELENKQLRYLQKNSTKDLESKLAFAYQKVQHFEQQSPYKDVFESYGKEVRKAEKQIEFLRNAFVETISAHETAYDSLQQKGGNVGRKDKLLLAEMRVLQRNNRQFAVDLKGRDLELNALKSKEKMWLAEHRDLDDLRKNVGKCQKELVKSESTIQSNEVTIGGSGKALAYLRGQYEALDAKNRENEKLIISLQSQIDRLTLKLQAGKIADKLDQPMRLPKIVDTPETFSPVRPAAPLLQNTLPGPMVVDKTALIKTHSQIKQCKTLITESLKTVRTETSESTNANLCAATDTLERSVAGALRILGELEMKELNYLNTISQLTGASPLRGKL